MCVCVCNVHLEDYYTSDGVCPAHMASQKWEGVRGGGGVLNSFRPDTFPQT